MKRHICLVAALAATLGIAACSASSQINTTYNVEKAVADLEGAAKKYVLACEAGQVPGCPSAQRVQDIKAADNALFQAVQALHETPSDGTALQRVQGALAALAGLLGSYATQAQAHPG